MEIEKKKEKPSGKEKLMKKVIVIGSPGAGKSTFSRKLRDVTGLPLYYLDMIWHKPDRTNISREELVAEQKKIMENRSWIIDGNYKRTLAERLRYADTVLLLAYSRTRCLWQIFRRLREFRGRTRPDLADGCPERIDGEFLRFVWNFNRRVLPEMRRILAKRPAECTLHEFHTPVETEHFLASLPPVR